MGLSSNTPHTSNLAGSIETLYPTAGITDLKLAPPEIGSVGAVLKPTLGEIAIIRGVYRGKDTLHDHRTLHQFTDLIKDKPRNIYERDISLLFIPLEDPAKYAGLAAAETVLGEAMDWSSSIGKALMMILPGPAHLNTTESIFGTFLGPVPYSRGVLYCFDTCILPKSVVQRAAFGDAVQGEGGLTAATLPNSTRPLVRQHRRSRTEETDSGPDEALEGLLRETYSSTVFDIRSKHPPKDTVGAMVRPHSHDIVTPRGTAIGIDDPGAQYQVDEYFFQRTRNARLRNAPLLFIPLQSLDIYTDFTPSGEFINGTDLLGKFEKNQVYQIKTSGYGKNGVARTLFGRFLRQFRGSHSHSLYCFDTCILSGSQIRNTSFRQASEAS